MRILMIGGAILALASGALMITSAGAQDGDRPGQTFITKVAEKLGISEDELTGAMTDAQFEIIDESVAEGRLTEEQAERLKERVEEYGPLSILGVGHHRPCRAAHFLGETAATVLGLEPDELGELVSGGQSLAQVAESQGMSADEFTEAFLAQLRADLDEKVAEGLMTAERADRAYERVENNIDPIVNFIPQEDGPRPCRPHHAPPSEDAPPANES